MDILESQYREHAVHSLLAETDDLLNGVDTKDWSVEALMYLEASLAMVTYASTRLAVQDYRLVPRAALDALDPLVRPLRSRVDAMSESEASALYNDAVHLMDRVSMLPVSVDAAGERLATTVIESVKRQARRGQDRIRGQVRTAESQIKSDREAVATDVAALQALKQAATTEVSALRDSATTEITKATDELTALRNNVTTVANEFQAEAKSYAKQINDSLAGIESRFQSAETTRAENANKAADDAREAHLEELRRAQTENQRLLDELAATNALALEVLENAGAASLADRWIKQAQGQMVERLIWTAVLAFAIIGSLVFGYLELHHLTAPHGSSWRDAAIFYFPRLPLAIITITAIGFMIRQVSRLSIWEARDRRVANELTALPALIARLDSEKQKDLVQVVSDRYLPGTEIRHDEPQQQPEDPLSAVSRGITAVVASLATAAAVLSLALIIALTR